MQCNIHQATKIQIEQTVWTTQSGVKRSTTCIKITLNSSEPDEHQIILYSDDPSLGLNILPVSFKQE